MYGEDLPVKEIFVYDLPNVGHTDGCLKVIEEHFVPLALWQTPQMQNLYDFQTSLAVVIF